MITYYDRICNAKTRFEAANLILAQASQCVSSMTWYTREQKLAIVEVAEKQAELLTCNYVPGTGELDPWFGISHPWKRALEMWGWNHVGMCGENKSCQKT